MAHNYGYDWSARVRSTTTEALRYSHFVKVMKRVLSFGAFAIIAAVLAFFFMERQPRRLQLAYEKLGIVKNDLAMRKPHLPGADSKGNPFVITADRAVQDAKNPKRATMKNMEADLQMDKGNWLKAHARPAWVQLKTCH